MMEAIEVMLENCLEALRRGESLETCLRRYPKQAESLRPLLETALLLEKAPLPALSPAGRQRGLDRMHQAMAERERKAAVSIGAPAVSAAPLQAWWHRLRDTFYWRTSFALATLALIVVIIGGSAGVVVSAESLPGDTFYPIKRVVEQARVTFAIGADAREQVLWEINQERLHEIERLESLGRSEKVHFEGVLENLQDNHWTVAGQVVVITADTIINGEPAAGHLVSVWGTLQAGGHIEATKVTIAQTAPVPTNLQGQIEQIADGRWIVSGHVVWVGRETALAGQPSVGWTVSIQGLLLADGSLRATQITALQPPPQPTATLPATGTATPPTGATPNQFVGGGSDRERTPTSTVKPSHPEETPQATATAHEPLPPTLPVPQMTKTVPHERTPIPRRTPGIPLTASPTEDHPKATPARSATARPTGTVRASRTPHPTVPALPTQWPEPTEWPQPTPPPEPTQMPEPTARPHATEPPEPTQPPEPTARPHATEPPEPTQPPEPTARPRPTEPPEPTQPPEPTARPQPTELPEPTQPPEPTARPQPTEPPEPTQMPEPTERPQPPEPTQQPEPTEPAQPPEPTEPPELPQPPGPMNIHQNYAFAGLETVCDGAGYLENYSLHHGRSTHTQPDHVIISANHSRSLLRQAWLTGSNLYGKVRWMAGAAGSVVRRAHSRAVAKRMAPSTPKQHYGPARPYS